MELWDPFAPTLHATPIAGIVNQLHCFLTERRSAFNIVRKGANNWFIVA